MLNNLRTWAAKRLRPPASRSRARDHHGAQEARDHRAASVVELRAQIRGLQQDITDLAGKWDPGSTPTADETARLRTLEQALERAQAELAKLQARV